MSKLHFTVSNPFITVCNARKDQLTEMGARKRGGSPGGVSNLDIAMILFSSETLIKHEFFITQGYDVLSLFLQTTKNEYIVMTCVSPSEFIETAFEMFIPINEYYHVITDVIKKPRSSFFIDKYGSKNAGSKDSIHQTDLSIWHNCIIYYSVVEFLCCQLIIANYEW